jgi:hypothetical protein
MYASDILNLTFFPKGAILTFSSTAWGATSPEFKNIWKVCNAANHAADPNNIPDLTNRFLRGADSSGSTGGADSRSVTLTANNLPSHNHDATGLTVSDLTLVPPALSPLSISGLSLANMAITGLTATEGGSHKHTLSGGTASDGAHGHSHNLSVGNDSHGHSLRGGAWGGTNCDGLTTSYQIAGRNAVHGSDNYYTNSPNGTAFISGNTHGHTLSGDVTSTNSAHSHGFSSASEAVTVNGHTHSVTGGTITGEITGGTITGGSLTGGSITGGSIGGSTANAGSSQAFSVDTVPSYYTVIYIIKIV